MIRFGAWGLEIRVGGSISWPLKFPKKDNIPKNQQGLGFRV